MILGFMLGWAAATWWWPWVLSFYEPKPLPDNGIRIERQTGGTTASGVTFQGGNGREYWG